MELTSERERLTRWRPWLGNHQLTWREDSTNVDIHHKRNWIRHELLPLLSSQLGREIPPILLRTSSLLRDQTLSLLKNISPFLSQPELLLSTLRSLSRAEQRLLIKSWLEHHSVSDISFEKIEAIVTMITQAKPAKMNLPAGDFVRRTNGKIWIERASKKPRNAVKK